MITIRNAAAVHVKDIARLLNKIIDAGGTTALTRPVSGQDIADWMDDHPDQSAWQVALDASDQVVGFQWITQAPYLPPEAAEIATFVQIGQTGFGIGSALFKATQNAARLLGYKWINANIRADNEGGLIYYQSRGFEDYGTIKGYKMQDGQIVDKRLKRFNL